MTTNHIDRYLLDRMVLTDFTTGVLDEGRSRWGCFAAWLLFHSVSFPGSSCSLSFGATLPKGGYSLDPLSCIVCRLCSLSKLTRAPSLHYDSAIVILKNCGHCFFFKTLGLYRNDLLTPPHYISLHMGLYASVF